MTTRPGSRRCERFWRKKGRGGVVDAKSTEPTDGKRPPTDLAVGRPTGLMERVLFFRRLRRHSDVAKCLKMSHPKKILNALLGVEARAEWPRKTRFDT